MTNKSAFVSKAIRRATVVLNLRLSDVFRSTGFEDIVGVKTEASLNKILKFKL